MSESSLVSTQSCVQSALDRPQSFYFEWTQRPEVAQALEKFKSEKEIRKTGRLDLVTWVQYICAFGYQGPSDEAWASLFASCRVLPLLSAEPRFLEEHEIAVLLAYAKIKPDHGDTMTSAQLVKHRIKPAVLGRQVARTPGILAYIRERFEVWALGPFTDMFCMNCMSVFSATSFASDMGGLPSNADLIGGAIRQCADAHASNFIKRWGVVITQVMDLNADETGQRKENFEAKLHEKRRHIYQQIFVTISEHWFNCNQGKAVLPQDTASLQYRRNAPLGSKNRRGSVPFKGEIDPQKDRMSELMRKAVIRNPPQYDFPPWATVRATLTICELHQPSPYGQAGLEFLPVEEEATSLVHLGPEQISNFTPSSTTVRLGSFDTDNRSFTIHGVPPSQMCRALQLTLIIGISAPKHGSDRPQFTITRIDKACWVELCPEEDSCRTISTDDEEQCKKPKSVDEACNDSFNNWLRAEGVGKHLQNGQGYLWAIIDHCEGMTKHQLKISVPERVLERLNARGKIPGESPSSILYDGSSLRVRTEYDRYGGQYDMHEEVCYESELGPVREFVEPVWLDCHASAKLTFVAPSGIKLSARTADTTRIFKSPHWIAESP